MIKKDIARILYEQHGAFTLRQAEDYTQIILDLIRSRVLSGETVTIANFGKFQLKKKSIREVRLPNGQKILTSAGERIQFIPSGRLKAHVNNQLGSEEPE